MSDPNKIVWIDGVPRLAPRQSVECVVTLLERWLEMAKSGEIQGVAMAAIAADGSAYTNMAGAIADRPILMRGAIATVSREFEDEVKP